MCVHMTKPRSSAAGLVLLVVSLWTMTATLQPVGVEFGFACVAAFQPLLYGQAGDLAEITVWCQGLHVSGDDVAVGPDVCTHQPLEGEPALDGCGFAIYRDRHVDELDVESGGSPHDLEQHATLRPHDEALLWILPALLPALGCPARIGHDHQTDRLVGFGGSPAQLPQLVAQHPEAEVAQPAETTVLEQSVDEDSAVDAPHAEAVW